MHQLSDLSKYTTLSSFQEFLNFVSKRELRPAAPLSNHRTHEITLTRSENIKVGKFLHGEVFGGGCCDHTLRRPASQY